METVMILVLLFLLVAAYNVGRASYEDSKQDEILEKMYRDYVHAEGKERDKKWNDLHQHVLNQDLKSSVEYVVGKDPYAAEVIAHELDNVIKKVKIKRVYKNKIKTDETKTV